jgi:hypothetical protein
LLENIKENCIKLISNFTRIKTELNWVAKLKYSKSKFSGKYEGNGASKKCTKTKTKNKD